MQSLRSPLHEALRKILRRERKEAGLSQKQLAGRVGCSQSAISNIETGGRGIDVAELVEVARAIGRDPRDLLAEAMAVADQPKMGKRTPKKK